MTNISNEIIYRRHSIKTLKGGEEWQATAYRGKIRIQPEIITAATKELAVSAVRQRLDEVAAKQRAKRGADGFPSVNEIHAALHVLELNKKVNKMQKAMLTAHLNAFDQILTATQLANAAGYNNYEAANRWYGQLGFDLAQELEWQPKEKRDGKPVWTFTLATDADGKTREGDEELTGYWRWKLRPEIIAAWVKGFDKP